MKCPRCKCELKQGTVRKSNVKIDYCPRCKGFFLDKGELEKISKVAIQELGISPEATQSRTLCPACEGWMFAFDYPQTFVDIDMCKQCKGLWLDPGELKEIDAVRYNLHKNGDFQKYDEVRGVKGWLIQFVDNAIDTLTHV